MNKRKGMMPEEQWLGQKEKILAWVRLGFSLAAVVVIHLNPERVARFPLLSQVSLYSFVFYSLLILYYTRREKWGVRLIGIASTCLDLLWVSLIVLSTGGSRTPFFVYYLFPVIGASSRYGIKGGMLVALVGVVLYGFIRFLPILERPLGIDTFIIRSSYLFVLAYIFGLISEFENRQNQKLMALYRTAGEAATQEERRRIARELHDSLLQVMASLTLRLEVSRRQLLHSPKELAREMESMEGTLRGTIEELRFFLAGKESLPLVPATLMERLRDEMKFFRDGLGLRVILESRPEDPALPLAVEREVYYVLREGLMNVARHSQASKTEIYFQEEDGEMLNVILQDDGIGFEPHAIREKGDGYGLNSMRVRVEKLGGKFSIDSSPGRGTRITFQIPLKPEA